jgi:hypothetical protein
MANDKPKSFGIGAYNVRPMDTEQPPQPAPTPYLERESGLPGLLGSMGGGIQENWQRQGNRLGAIKNFFTGSPQTTNIVSGQPFSQATPLLGTGTSVLDAVNASMREGQAGQMDTGQAPYLSAGGPYQLTFEEYAGIGAGGGGSAGPDYSAYRAALTDQAQQINAQIQAMYNQLGEAAGANVARLEDIYGGAQTGIGDVYGSASANTADAYGSSQQQAADQLARLGIEAAAPAVVNPMALSQAEALAGLEAGKAGGQAAAERYGATAGGFGSQMAQVAQQQGTEMNAAVLNALQNRLNDSLLMELQGSGSGGGGGMSVADQMRLREQYNRDVLGQLPFDEQLALDKAAFEQGQAGADIQLGREAAISSRYQQLYAIDPKTAEEQLNYEISAGLI